MESPEYAHLLHRRSCLEQELDTVVQLGMDIDDNIDSCRKFKVSCSNISRIQDQFENIQTAIEMTELKEKKMLSTDHSSIRASFNEVIREILSIKAALDERDTSKVLNNSCESKRDHIPVQLPRLSVPQFSGDYREWKSFSDLFKSLIDQNDGLSDVAKFQYLMSYVKGDASKLLKGLPLTEQNYKKAWAILEYNFNNERLIAMQHMDLLFKLPNLNSPSASGLRHLVTGFIENVGALDSMGFPVDSWDFILFHMLYRKVDPETRRDFDKSMATNRIPKCQELREFLDREIVAWENSRSYSRPVSHSNNNSMPSSSRARATSTFVTSSSSARNSKQTGNCILCNRGAHSIISCSVFKRKAPYDRFVFAKEQNLCLKCLKPMHDANDTCSKIHCLTCNASHHNTLLHYAKAVIDAAKPNEESAGIVSLCSSEPTESTSIVLLSTAIVMIRDSLGKFHRARALVDPGSEGSFISKSLVSRLGLPQRNVDTFVQGIGHLSTHSKGVIETVIRSHNSSMPLLNFRAFILNHITSDKPSSSVDTRSWSHLSNLILADPHFDAPAPIEILLGGDIYEDIFLGETIRGPKGTPMAISSSLGWLLIGKVDLKFMCTRDSRSNLSSFLVSSQEESLDLALRRFWEVEAVPEKPIISEDDFRCEQIFVKTHKRDASGRYIVSLPFREGDVSLGESRYMALKRLRSMERRFVKDEEFKLAYFNFMIDYLKSGHMELVQENVSGKHYFIPHHGILRPTSKTTKLRVVFDASATTSNGSSLNDFQLVGPKLQKDIGDLLCNFRLHKIAFTADIRQMYRQILVSKNDQNDQLILWRTSADENPQVYRLKTVTYGLSSSPFLAIRVLQQLAEDHSLEFPEAANVIRRFTYMDDVISGSDSIDSAIHLQRQLFELLQRGGFELRKWCSNNAEFLEQLPKSARDIESSIISLDEDNSVKVLGLAWQPLLDVFSYTVEPLHDKVTKRVVLSETARIFDPLGYLCPVIITAKVLFQELWLAGVDWDAEVPDDIRRRWLHIVHEFAQLSRIRIPRFVPTKLSLVEMHGFCDSSEAAFAAVVYFRVVHPDQQITVHLITAKSKVASKGKEQEKYIINTSSCSIPNYAKAVKYRDKSWSSSSCGQRAVHTDNSDGNVRFRIDGPTMRRYTRGRPYQCCYQFVIRSRKQGFEDKRVEYTPCTSFQNGTKTALVQEVIKVTCRCSSPHKKLVYEDVYMHVQARRSRLEARGGRRGWSVLLLGMDTMARARAYSSLTQTVAYMRENDWLDFKGYHKVGDNTLPNLIPLLTGQNISYAERECVPSMENCKQSLIWSAYSASGFVTAFGEDFLSLPDTFSRQNGFVTPPTDHYMRPLFLTKEHMKKDLLCTKKMPSAQHILNYAYEFSAAYKNDQSFGMFWLNSFSHNLNASPKLIDADIVKFFQKLSKSGVLENSFVIFFSDHGMRFGNLRKQTEMYYEERLPMLFIWIPRSFRKMYQQSYWNIQLNQNRLISPFDLYITLSDILKLSANISTDGESIDCPECHSLFREVSHNRSCTDAGITNKWCSCHDLRKVSLKELGVVKSVKVLTSYLYKRAKSTKTKNCTKCTTTRLKNLIRSHTYNLTGKTYYLLAFTMSPGEVAYEATLEHSGSDLRLLAPLQTLSSYNSHGSCVTTAGARPFCVCVSTHCTVK